MLQTTANKGVMGQPFSSPSPSLMKGRTPPRPPVSFSGSIAIATGPMKMNISFDFGKDLISFRASDGNSLLDPEKEDRFR